MRRPAIGQSLVPLPRVVISVGLSAVLLVSCGSGGGEPSGKSGGRTTPDGRTETVSPPSKRAGEITACSLVTLADVEEVAAATVTPGTAQDGPSNHITLCQFQAAGLLVRVSPEIGDQEHAAFPFEDPKAVPGLGDDALIANTNPGVALSVLKGSVEISIFFTGNGDGAAITEELARRALTKLGA
jgi:hypothetical protein